MQNILQIRDNLIFLNSSLSEEIFAKTKFSLMLNEIGYIVSQDENGNFSKFSSWKFTGTKTIEENAWFCGEGFNGKIAEDIIASNSKTSKEMLYDIIQAYFFAMQKNIAIPINGLAGIVYNEEKKLLLFVPEKTFDKCAANLGKNQYEEIQNVWRDGAAEGAEAYRFAISACAYYAITNNFPYPADTAEKTVKISDRNFLPLEFAVNGIDKNLAKAVNSGLLGKNWDLQFPLDSLKAEIFEKESHKHSMPAKEFEESVKSYVISRQKKLKRRKLIERNRTKWIICAVAAIFVAVSITSIVRESGRKPCVIGLKSDEVAEVFYSGIHHMDTDYLLASAKECPQAQVYISQIPQIYVSSQMRSAYNFDTGLSTPENWMFFEPDTKKSYSHYIYGITQFKIDGKPSTLNRKSPTKKNHPHRITHSEKGIKIELDDEKSHDVEYYLVHNEDNQISINHYKTQLSMKYIKDRWQISNMEQHWESEIISPLPFSLDYKQALIDFDNDEIKAINSLRENYYWLPTEESLLEEKQRLDQIGY